MDKGAAANSLDSTPMSRPASSLRCCTNIEQQDGRKPEMFRSSFASQEQSMQASGHAATDHARGSTRLLPQRVNGLSQEHKGAVQKAPDEYGAAHRGGRGWALGWGAALAIAPSRPEQCNDRRRGRPRKRLGKGWRRPAWQGWRKNTRRTDGDCCAMNSHRRLTAGEVASKQAAQSCHPTPRGVLKEVKTAATDPKEQSRAQEGAGVSSTAGAGQCAGVGATLTAASRSISAAAAAAATTPWHPNEAGLAGQGATPSPQPRPHRPAIMAMTVLAAGAGLALPDTLRGLAAKFH